MVCKQCIHSEQHSKMICEEWREGVQAVGLIMVMGILCTESFQLWDINNPQILEVFTEPTIQDWKKKS